MRTNREREGEREREKKKKMYVKRIFLSQLKEEGQTQAVRFVLSLFYNVVKQN